MVEVSQSAEMAPYTLGNDYDRPIPRRILESSGVPRELFGMRKKAVASHYNLPKNLELRRRFLRDIGRTPAFGLLYDTLNEGAYRLQRLAVYVLARGDRMRALGRHSTRLRFFKKINLRAEMYVWATRVLSEELRRALAAHAPGLAPAARTTPRRSRGVPLSSVGVAAGVVGEAIVGESAAVARTTAGAVDPVGH